MTKEELAAKLNGRGIGDEITPDEEKQAARLRLLVIFGASDDLCELRGAIYDELGAWHGKEVYVTREGELLPEVESDDADVLRRYGVLATVNANRASAIKVKALWCEDGGKGPAWTYKTAEPHATFDVMEDGAVWCRGIVVQL